VSEEDRVGKPGGERVGMEDVEGCWGSRLAMRTGLGLSRTTGPGIRMKWCREAETIRAAGRRMTKSNVRMPDRFFVSRGSGIRDRLDSAIQGDFGEVTRGKGNSVSSGFVSESEGGREGSSAGAGNGRGDGGGVNIVK